MTSCKQTWQRGPWQSSRGPPSLWSLARWVSVAPPSPWSLSRWVMFNNDVDMTRDFMFKYSNKDFIYTTSSEHGLDKMSPFDSLLLKKWEAARDAALFNYQVDDVETKIIPGKYKLVAQMNANRKTMRRKPQNIFNVTQPFDPETFNFTKIKKQEILARLLYNQISPEVIDGEEIAGNGRSGLEGSLTINTAPICYSHSLLVPFLARCRPQVVSEEGLLLALHSILLSQTPDLRIAFNSLGGYASVNHQHFHIYYLPHELHIETAECLRLAGPCYIFKDYHAPGYVFQLENGAVDELTRSVMKVIKLFHREEMAHNLYITRGTSLDGNSIAGRYDTIRVILWARKLCYGIKDITVFAAAACELAGHVPIYSSEHWSGLSEEAITHTTKSVCEDHFVAMNDKITKLFSENSILE
nr:GDP-D-glucose phosphorylase 1-like isoform X1 [Procambarus clarkii]